jgi:hypothetical protein
VFLDKKLAERALKFETERRVCGAPRRVSAEEYLFLPLELNQI